MTGTAVFRIVVSSDSMKNATATSQGSSRLLDAAGGDAAQCRAELYFGAGPWVTRTRSSGRIHLRNAACTSTGCSAI